MAKLGKEESDIKTITLEDVVNVHLSSFTEYISSTSHSPLVNAHSLSQVILVKLGEMTYRRGASSVLSEDRAFTGIFSTLFKVIPFDQYMSIVKAIRVVPDAVNTSHFWTAQQDQIDLVRDLDQIFSRTFRYILCESSIISLDDDKLRKLSSSFHQFGLKTVFTRNSGACPVMHMISSVLTGCTFSFKLDLPGIALLFCFCFVRKCIRVSLKSLCCSTQSSLFIRTSKLNINKEKLVCRDKCLTSGRNFNEESVQR